MSLEKQDLFDAALRWKGIWKQRPFENNNGLACLGAFSLFYFLREMSPRPELVFEIGTWRGFSTWVIRQALPGVKIVCSDPILASRQFLDQRVFLPEYRVSNVDYTWQDFSNIDFNVPDGMRDKVAVFFDDHQNKLPRTIQAAQKGIKHIIFDDNVPFKYSHETFENSYTNTQGRDSIFGAFSRYDIFPPFFDAVTKSSVNLEGIFDYEERHLLPEFYDSREVYSWVTKIELADTMT